MSYTPVSVHRLPHGEGLPLPGHATAESAGVDLLAAVGGDLILDPGARAVVPTGIAIALPPGFGAQLRPRSGLAAKHGVTVLNSPGTIDADYRGEIGVVLVSRDAPVASFAAFLTALAWPPRRLGIPRFLRWTRNLVGRAHGLAAQSQLDHRPGCFRLLGICPCLPRSGSFGKAQRIGQANPRPRE